jgi:hypothetical protein
MQIWDARHLAELLPCHLFKRRLNAKHGVNELRKPPLLSSALCSHRRSHCVLVPFQRQVHEHDRNSLSVLRLHLTKVSSVVVGASGTLKVDRSKLDPANF